MEVFEDNFKNCLENLRQEKYRVATSYIYPISKKTALLGNASDGEVERFSKSISEVVALLAEKIGQCSDVSEEYRHMLTDAYRILRNSCGASTKVQRQLGGAHGPQLMKSSEVIADVVLKLVEGESLVQALAVVIQFLFNLGSGMEGNQDLVWDHFKTKLRTWLAMADGGSNLDQELAVKILNVTCALVEVCICRQLERQEEFLKDPLSREILLSVIQAASGFTFDYGKKVMMKVVQIPDLLKQMFGDLTLSERHFVNNCLKDVINDWRSIDENDSKAPKIQSNLQFLAETVIMSRPLMTAEKLSRRSANSESDLHQHVKMLEVLSVASCCKAFAPVLNSVVLSREEGPKTLVEYAIGFLKDIHEEGKKKYNMLSMVKSKKEVDTSHPGYLLRCDLMRLIGNLSYQNKAVQDAVREYDGKTGLSVILEQTVIDERNPFLAEWAKLALSNLVRQNEENAKFIHSMSQQGQIKGTVVLKTCGLILEKEGNQVKIRAEGSAPSLKELSEKEPSRP